MTPSQDWLAIALAGQTSSPAWLAAFEQLGGPEAVRAAPATHLAGLGLSDATIERLKSPDAAAVELCNAWLEQRGHRLLTSADPHWPAQLRSTSGAPVALWLRGGGQAAPADVSADLLSAPQIAIVGSRSATSGGIANAQAFAQALGASGLTVTSGLAVGIDAAAHTGALDTTGGTIAVLGNGIDAVYPRDNCGLAERIAEHGLIVSEYPPGTPPQRHQFPARNRIIAALSLGVLVVEAGAQSGSLITARLAGERGREIFAIPGSIHNPVARGCHRLIRQGAKLVETADDILVELAPMLRAALQSEDATRHNETEQHSQPPPAHRELLNSLGFDPTDIGELVARTTLTTAEVSSMLLLLELEGYVEALPGGRYLRK